MILSLSTTAFALSEKPEEYFAITPLEQVENNGKLVPAITQEDTYKDGIEEKALTLVYGEYLRVYPVFELNGKYYSTQNCYKQYRGNPSFTYIRQSISYDIQEEMKQYVMSLGYKPVGWYIEAALRIEAKQPKYIDYQFMDHNGLSSLKRINLNFNGLTKFTCIGLYPQDTSKDYTYGMTGHAYYIPYNSFSTAKMAVELSAVFKTNR